MMSPNIAIQNRNLLKNANIFCKKTVVHMSTGKHHNSFLMASFLRLKKNCVIIIVILINFCHSNVDRIVAVSE